MDLLQKSYIEQVIQDYEQGKTISQIAKKYKKSSSMIKVDLLELGGKKGQEILLKELERASGLPVMEIIEKYKHGKNIEQLKKEYGAKSKISYIINQYQVITGEKVLGMNNSAYRDDLDREKIVQEYREGKKESQLADENHVAISTIRRIVTKYADKNGYDIYDDHEKSAAKRIQDNNISNSKDNKEDNEEDNKENDKEKLKIASLNSVIKIVKKYRYGYYELFQIGLEKGYFVSKATYERALELIEEQKKGEEVEW